MSAHEMGQIAHGVNKTMLWYVRTVIIVIALCVYFRANASSLGNFNPFPELPYEVTSVQQDEWVKIAQQLVADGVEAAPIDACQKLIDAPTTPFELKRWATLRQVQLLCYTQQESVAVQIAAQWLTQHGDRDPNPLAIRSVVAKIVGIRGHALFRPGFEEIKLAYDDLFRHHQGNEWDLIEAHIDFARHLNYRYADTHDTKVLEDRVSHLMLAESKIRQRLAEVQNAGDTDAKASWERTLREVTPQLDKAIEALERRVAADRLRPVQGQGAAQAAQDRPQPSQNLPGAPPSPPRP
jgi:hypothetical protein